MIPDFGGKQRLIVLALKATRSRGFCSGLKELMRVGEDGEQKIKCEVVISPAHGVKVGFGKGKGAEPRC